ncbi:MAG TPA: glycosyltransferase [Candidatus Bathyarchaeia archaeon]
MTRIANDSTRNNEPLVSILIPTYNSAKTIKECLDSAKTQTYTKLEIIVIDNHSSDETRSIAQKYCSQIFVVGPERSAQMNYGVSHSQGKYILRVDSDMILDNDLVKDCLTLCQEGVQAVVIPVLPHPSGPKNFWVSCRMLEQRMIMDDLVNVAPRFIDRTVFLSVGGYDEKIVAFEDYDLHNRLLKSGCSVACLQQSALWHLGEASSLSEVVIRMIKYGKTGSLGQFTKKHGSGGLKQISIIRPSYFRHRNLFISDPLHFTGIFVMKFVQSCSVATGALLRHLP